jgi:hypothetical protein
LLNSIIEDLVEIEGDEYTVADLRTESFAGYSILGVKALSGL